MTVKDAAGRVWELRAPSSVQANNWAQMVAERTGCVALGKARGLW
eukprot:COSAG01_NODE_3783_length_5698_cov_58.077692_8_plen_45_part_00